MNVTPPSFGFPDSVNDWDVGGGGHKMRRYRTVITRTWPLTSDFKARSDIGWIHQIVATCWPRLRFVPFLITLPA